MPDFIQHGLITTLHDLGTIDPRRLEAKLAQFTRFYKIGVILPVTASDMKAPPFARMVEQLKGIEFIDQILVVLNVATDVRDYQHGLRLLEPLQSLAQILWTDGRRVSELYQTLQKAGLNVATPGKGRAVWTAFGYLMADQRLKAYVLQDCDIVNYDRQMLTRLCFPMAHPGLDFEFCKAYYARVSDRMHGRVVRLLVQPLLAALISMLGNHRFLDYLNSFRYPLSGEFAVTSNLARSNRIPSDWGLEVGTLAEVYRNTSLKRVCQVDMFPAYDHKHQDLSIDDPSRGLLKMATDILTSVLRTLSSMGLVLEPGHFVTLRSAFLREAQDSVRQYYADSTINGLNYDRHAEEGAVEAFADQVMVAADLFQQDVVGTEALPNWTRVVTAFPDLPEQLREACRLDREEFGFDSKA
jgi:glucosyl-3-phosphoglycerate synthase